MSGDIIMLLNSSNTLKSGLKTSQICRYFNILHIWEDARPFYKTI